ncbi:MAG: TIGR03905 family TSCPD domain-containing protein [Candidatus Limiplasma sp.]|nr:TIGR03905 family TSCPD domain-containing protein [Candidatus Limiplasma sp.]MEA5146828.1 TIGR03905 family TSCPD domain-containing protein [Candidatus Limiplasma sp.]
MHYRTKGTCSTGIDLEIEDGVITACSFTKGCSGNLTGLSRLVVGQNAATIMETLRGVVCQGATSCPDQLSRAIEAYLNQTPPISKEL